MATLGRSPGAAPLTSADIPDDSITAAKIVAGAVSSDVLYLENNTSTQTLSGTYSTERLYFNDSYQLTGDVTVTGHLALGSIADEDVVITQDSTERTITGAGTLEAGNVLQDTHRTSLTDMTGTLGSAVNLDSATFPDGHILQVVSSGAIATTTAASGTSWTPTGVTVSITPSNSAHDILVMADIGSYIYNSAGASSTLYVGLSADAGTSFLTQKQMRIHDYGGSGQLHVMSVPFHFLHSPSTISSVTYSIYFKKVTGEAASVNEDDSDSVIIAFEISDS